jgi:predicted nucleotidyltransferase
MRSARPIKDTFSMRNPHAERRIEFAREMAHTILNFEGVQAIVVAGSVARGYADEYSDLELPIFWNEVPRDPIRISMANALRGEFLFSFDGPSREDQLVVEGSQVDLWHIAVRSQEQIIQNVLQRHDTDLESLNAMDTIRCCIPIYGEERIARWKSQAQNFPAGLALAILREKLPSFRVDQLSTYARRGNPTGFYSELCRLQCEAFLVLLALNLRYFPTFKWLYRVLEELEVKPRGVAARMRRAFAASHEDAVKETRQLLLEILQLVDDRYPGFDLTSVHRRLDYLRPSTGRPSSL